MWNQQLRVLHLRTGQGSVWVGDDCCEGIIYEAIQAGHSEDWLAGVVRVDSSRRQTLHLRPENVQLVGAAEWQTGSLLADVFGVEHDVAGQFPLDSKAPTLFIRCPVRDGGAERAVGVKSNIVHQSQRISRRLNQTVRVRIAQVQVRSVALVLIG